MRLTQVPQVARGREAVAEVNGAWLAHADRLLERVRDGNDDVVRAGVVAVEGQRVSGKKPAMHRVRARQPADDRLLRARELWVSPAKFGGHDPGEHIGVRHHRQELLEATFRTGARV
jgi:hypothetical protein